MGPDDTTAAEFRVPREHAGLRAELFLAMVAPFLSRTRIRQKIQQGEALRNGRRFAAGTRLQAGDRIELRWREGAARLPAGGGAGGEPPAPDLPVLHEDGVLFEDGALLALHKPAGMAVHPTGRKQSGTLIQAVHARHRAEIGRSLAAGDTGFYPGLVNRLDLFTSGIVLVAKTRDVLRAMHRLAAAGGVRKRYRVLVRGSVEPGEGRIDRPIGRDASSRIGLKQAVRPDGLASVTEYRVLAHLPGHTLLHAWPLSGRQHQIRVHFASLDHPVWGDLIYADEDLFRRYYANGCRLDGSLPPRQGLHAEWVAFPHPLSGETVEVTAPPPADFAAILAALPAGPEA